MTKTKRLHKCDYCGSTENVKEILYGMPAENYDKTKYVIGGCIPNTAKFTCKSCGWTD